MPNKRNQVTVRLQDLKKQMNVESEYSSHSSGIPRSGSTTRGEYGRGRGDDGDGRRSYRNDDDEINPSDITDWRRDVRRPEPRSEGFSRPRQDGDQDREDDESADTADTWRKNEPPRSDRGGDMVRRGDRGEFGGRRRDDGGPDFRDYGMRRRDDAGGDFPSKRREELGEDDWGSLRRRPQENASQNDLDRPRSQQVNAWKSSASTSLRTAPSTDTAPTVAWRGASNTSESKPKAKAEVGNESDKPKAYIAPHARAAAAAASTPQPSKEEVRPAPEVGSAPEVASAPRAAVVAEVTSTADVKSRTEVASAPASASAPDVASAPEVSSAPKPVTEVPNPTELPSRADSTPKPELAAPKTAASSGKVGPYRPPGVVISQEAKPIRPGNTLELIHKLAAEGKSKKGTAQKPKPKKDHHEAAPSAANQRLRMMACPSAMKKLEELFEGRLTDNGVPEDISTILGDDHKSSTIPLLVAAKNLMRVVLQLRPLEGKSMGNDESELVQQQVAKAGPYITKVIEHVSEVDRPSLQFIYETHRVSHALGFPRLSVGWSLIEAVWHALLICQIIPKEIFLQWKELSDEFDSVPQWSVVMMQVKPWFAWLEGATGGATNVEEAVDKQSDDSGESEGSVEDG